MLIYVLQSEKNSITLNLNVGRYNICDLVDLVYVRVVNLDYHFPLCFSTILQNKEIVVPLC